MATKTNHRTKLISPRLHGVIDYLMGGFWLFSPWLLGFSNSGPATLVPATAGVLVILYSLLTDYELGLFDTISMQSHLVIDRAVALFMILSPWLFGFASHVWMPHVITGVLSIVVTYLTFPRMSAWARLRRLMHYQARRLSSATR